MCKSEIALLRQQITRELVAMRLWLQGVALGTARHAFIHTRMERVAVCQATLAGQVGETAAREMVCSLYVQTMEPEGVPDVIS